MPRYLTRIVALLATGLLAVSGLGAAHADEAPAAELQPVMVVMDYSSSMLETDADDAGTSRIDAAKTATKHLINNAPQDASMGLVVYGSRTPQKCDDILTVQKPGPVDKQGLSAKLDDLKAVGETPIGASLLHAAKELEGIEGAKSIILVSDGEENCSQPPACEAAEELAGQGIDLTVHTIGFKVNSKARAQLECIAKATGGSYVTADDAEALQEELTIRTLRAFQGYAASGTPIEGSTQMHQAPAMVPGQYLDTLEKGETRSWSSKDGTTKYYKIGPLSPGERAHLSATMIPDQSQMRTGPAIDHGRVSVALVNGQGRECSVGRSEMTNTTQLGRPMSGYVHNPEYRQDSSSGCFADGTGELFAKVTRDGDLQKDTPMDVELRYVLEPAVDPILLGAAASGRDNPQSVAVTGSAEPVSGGSSFNDALAVESGKIYADSALTNEARYYKVHVGNGQKLNVRATGGNNTEAGTNEVRLRVYSAVRDQVDMLGQTQLSRHRPEDTVTLNMATAVDQSNRDGGVGSDAYLAGDYYVVVHSTTWSLETNGVPFDYELAFEVTGTEQPFAGAAPVFEAEPAGGQQQEPAVDPTEPGAGDDPDSGAVQDATDEQELAVGPASDSSRALWPWFTAGLVGTAALLGIGGFLMRHRATARTETPAQDHTQPGGRP
ncbi:VWA domain-containing protein [Glutamicibacter sp. MNS18]|uniref:vWA domain-containing protein n=1 Tax=Glutamicibacter sp. MNS18 TaxID=2989817 RepID=UPI002235EDB9|nr:VWA domain-containing protein [Glutamicibacter sp. MNS18]MCW4466711.1 VWA domain-containing protein [Glutamicibacter sp. MNS18]